MRRLTYAFLLILTFFACLGQQCIPNNLLDPNNTGSDGTDNNNINYSGINAKPPSGEIIPELGSEVSLKCISQSRLSAQIEATFYVGNIAVRRTILQLPPYSELNPVGPDKATSVTVSGSYGSGKPIPVELWLLSQDFEEGDIIEYILADPIDDCPDDPDKTKPGICGCGVSDTDDRDADGVPDCIDNCPDDPLKSEPGDCGCNNAEIDTDQDGTSDCIDGCPDDPNKIDPGACGCGISDDDANGNGIPDCKETNPPPPDSDGDGIPNSQDNCPYVPNSGQEDYDDDGIGDACDNCMYDRNPKQIDIDNDQVGDVCDYCIDLDGDGYGNPGFPMNYCMDDNCPEIANPDQTDSDNDGVGDACDHCPDTLPEIQVNEYGCADPASPADFDKDGDIDLNDFAILQICFTGPSDPVLPECVNTDLNCDDHVDSIDLDLFMLCFSGADIPSDPFCGDFNENKISDACEINSGVLEDCNENLIPDVLDILNKTSDDCNNNSIPDECDLASELSDDCNENTIPDECELGICCDTLSGECGETYQDSCPYQWRGPCATCDECQYPDGACCDSSIGTCYITSSDQCEFEWLGPDTTCDSCYPLLTE